ASGAVDRRGGGEQSGFGVADDYEGQRLAGFVRRALAERGGPSLVVGGVFGASHVAAGGEARRVVDGSHIDDESLLTKVDVRCGVAAGVGKAQCNGGRTIGVRCRGVGQSAIGGNGGAGGEQARVGVVLNAEDEWCLTSFVGGTGSDRSGPR